MWYRCDNVAPSICGAFATTLLHQYVVPLRQRCSINRWCRCDNVAPSMCGTDAAKLRPVSDKKNSCGPVTWSGKQCPSLRECLPASPASPDTDAPLSSPLCALPSSLSYSRYLQSRRDALWKKHPSLYSCPRVQRGKSEIRLTVD